MDSITGAAVGGRMDISERIFARLIKFIGELFNGMKGDDQNE